MGNRSKFSANRAVSKILDIDIQVGRTGALTPVKIKPINIGGVLFLMLVFIMRMK